MSGGGRPPLLADYQHFNLWFSKLYVLQDKDIYLIIGIKVIELLTKQGSISLLVGKHAMKFDYLFRTLFL